MSHDPPHDRIPIHHPAAINASVDELGVLYYYGGDCTMKPRGRPPSPHGPSRMMRVPIGAVDLIKALIKEWKAQFKQEPPAI